MKKMNASKYNSQESSAQDGSTSDRGHDTYLTVDGEAWDVSNLLNSLPTDESTKQHEMRSVGSMKKAPYSNDVDEKQEDRKLPASVKKGHNGNLTLKKKPKYEWRASHSQSPPQLPAPSSPVRETSPEASYDEQNSSYSQHRQQQQQQNKQLDDFQRSMIEVFPGVEMPLRGSVETQGAIERNYVLTANCVDCTLQLRCIRNAEYILCPLCHCVTPLEWSSANLEQGAFGVGLGYVEDEP